MPRFTIWIKNQDLDKWKAATVDGQSKWVSEQLDKIIIVEEGEKSD